MLHGRFYPSHHITTLPRGDFFDQLRRSYQVHFRFYQSHHRTVGCRVTHMIGIPMLILSFFLIPYKPKAAAQLQVGGWILQFIGHFVFEHNKPVLLEMRDGMTVWAALVFVYRLWQKVFAGSKIASKL